MAFFSSKLPGSAWPPGPPSGLTGWGLLRQMAKDLPGSLADWQAAYGDVFSLRIWPEREVVLANPDLAREVLVRHHDRLARWEHGLRVFARIHGGSVLVAEGNDWQEQRQALRPFFSPQSVADFQTDLVRVAITHLDRWPFGAARPVEQGLTDLTMSVILQRLASAPHDNVRAVSDAFVLVSQAMNTDFYRPWAPYFPLRGKVRRALAILHEFIEHTVSDRLQMPIERRPRDLLTHLLALHGQDGGKWPLRWVRDEAVTAFLAGFETTAATLAWWTWCMAQHPQEQERVRAEVQTVLGQDPPTSEDLARLPILTQSVQEVLRLYPAAPVLLGRRTTAPLELGGWCIPKRTLLIIPVMQIQRDPRWFPDPLAFRPERFAPTAAEIPRGAWMPFGAGPRVCLGQGLAMAEIVTVAALLLQRFRMAVPANSPPIQPVMRVSLRPDTPLQLDLLPL